MPLSKQRRKLEVQLKAFKARNGKKSPKVGKGVRGLLVLLGLAKIGWFLHLRGVSGEVFGEGDGELLGCFLASHSWCSMFSVAGSVCFLQPLSFFGNDCTIGLA